MSKEIQFIFNPSEIGAGTRGASLGPDAIMTAARKNQSNLFLNREIKVIKDFNFLLDQPEKKSFAKNINGILEVFDCVSNEIQKSLSNEQFPLIIAGDHSSAGGTIQGIAQGFPNKKIGVLWIDAHADLHTPYTTPSGNVHGMPLATALGIDNLECKKNEIDTELKNQWEQLKSGVISAENLVFIAVRDTEKEENYLLSSHKIKNYTVNEVRELGVENLLKKLNDKFSQMDLLYVSFDVDSMDPLLTSHGTGTPVPNGLTPDEAKQILTGVCKFNNLIALELVEVNPCLDENKNKMAETALELLEAITETLEK
jgi:arginase